MMTTTRKRLLFGGGGAAALLTAAAAAFALAPERGPAAADLDKDGKITAAEIRTTAQRKFAAADANKDGKLTGDEIKRGGRHGGRHHRDGPAPPPLAASSGNPQADATAAPMQSRPRLDADGDGAVTAAEFEQGFARRLARADANGDGTVTTEELAAAKPQRRHHRP